MISRYNKTVLAELKKLRLLSFKLMQEKALESLAKDFTKWQNKKISSELLEKHIQEHQALRLSDLKQKYKEEGDPGVPVAEALIQGLLKKNEMSEETYKAISLLIDLVNI